MGSIKCLKKFFTKVLLGLILSGSILPLYSQKRPKWYSPADTLVMYLPEGAPDKLLLDSLCLMNASLDSVLDNLTSRLIFYRELFVEIWNQDDTTWTCIRGAVPNFLFEDRMINRIYGYLTLNGKRVYVLDDEVDMDLYFKKSSSSGYVYWEIIKKEPEDLAIIEEEPRWWYFIQDGKMMFDFSDFTDGELLPEKPSVSK